MVVEACWPPGLQLPISKVAFDWYMMMFHSKFLALQCASGISASKYQLAIHRLEFAAVS